MDLVAQNRTYHVAQNSMELLPNYFKWTYGVFGDEISGTVIELGCGAGLGIGCYLDRADGVVAVDHNTELLERVKARFPGDKVRTIKADLLNDWGELKDVRGDAVILMDVLEHFKDDRSFLEKAAGMVADGGRLIIKVPAQQSMYSDMDKASGHFRRYDRPDLLKLAEQIHFDAKFIRPINVAGAVAYKMRGDRKSNFSGTFSIGQLSLINRLMPFISLADIASFMPGLSYVACLTRRK